MKNLLFVALTFFAFGVSAQSTDAALTTQINTFIRPLSYNNKNAADMFKAIVDSKINSLNGLSGQNGITTSGTQISLGGTLNTGFTNVTLQNGSFLNLGNGSGSTNSFLLAGIAGGLGNFVLQSSNGTTRNNLQIGTTATGMVIESTVLGFQGLLYASDYRANFTSNSLVSSAWVTSQPKTFNSAQSFQNGTLQLLNPAATFSYAFLSSAIAANRNVTFPLLLSDDTFVFENHGQNLTNKNFSTGNSFISSPTINAGIKFTFSPNTTTAGLNFGSFAGDPSTLVNGDAWYNSTSNIFRARQNGVTGTLAINPLTNNNEILASTATGGIQSSDFLSTTTTKTLGLSTNAATTQTLTVNGSSANVGLTINSKADGQILILAGSNASTFFGLTNNARIEIAGGTSRQITFNNASGGGVRFAINNQPNGCIGTATLVGGTATVNNTAVTVNSLIFYTVTAAGGTQGIIRTSAITAGTSFTITSSSGTDTSTVAYLIIN